MYPESKGGKGGVKMMNVPSPGGLTLPPDVTADIRRKVWGDRKATEQEYPVNVCGGCGKAGGENGGVATLMNCAKCKVRKYCSKECQKKHWKAHKRVCKAPEGAATEDHEV